jgi:signal transduction histidine kinase
MARACSGRMRKCGGWTRPGATRRLGLHDLRTPLASLLAMIDALADDVVSDPETVKRYLRQCEAEIGRMSTLIDAARAHS